MSDRKSKIEFEKSSGNVYADLGLEGAEELYTRAALGIEVIKIIKARSYSQKEAAKILNIKQPEVSALMCAKFQRFSQERLIGFLNRLDQKVTIRISRHRKGEPFQEIAVAT